MKLVLNFKKSVTKIYDMRVTINDGLGIFFFRKVNFGQGICCKRIFNCFRMS